MDLAEGTVVKSADASCVALRDGGLALDTDHPLGLYSDPLGRR